MLKKGYAQVSTLEQNADPQLKAIKLACRKEVFKDQKSGKQWNGQDEKPLLNR